MTHSLNTDATGPSEPSAPEARQGFVAVDGAELYYRDVGQGQPIIILHGGPDFDHTYLLPDMDRLADGYRLIYYDQRGRGRSTGQPADVSLASELADLDTLRQHLGLERAVLLAFDAPPGCRDIRIVGTELLEISVPLWRATKMGWSWKASGASAGWPTPAAHQRPTW
jgi:pimeloyl-ACP methyl ester carboxylesterase